MKFIIFKGRDNYWYWHLESANNEIVAKGHQAYVHKQDCLYGIQLVKDIDRQRPTYER